MELGQIIQVRRFVLGGLIFLALNAVWEILQLPLYTLWDIGSAGEIGFALVHCTAGDLFIGFVIALMATIILRAVRTSHGNVAFLIIFLSLGTGYTVFSEWLNVHVRRSWAYTDLMPMVPFGTGLAPLLQWIFVPLLTWWLVVRKNGEPNERFNG